MYASVVFERHRAISVAAEVQVLTLVFLADDHAGLKLHLERCCAILMKREKVRALPIVIQLARSSVG